MDPSKHPDSLVRVAAFNRGVSVLRLPVTIAGGLLLYVHTDAPTALVWLSLAATVEVVATIIRSRLMTGDLRYRSAHLAGVTSVILMWLALALLLWASGKESGRIAAFITLLTVTLFGVARGHKDRRIMFLMVVPCLVTFSILLSIYFWETASLWIGVLGSIASIISSAIIYANARALYASDKAFFIASTIRDRLTEDLQANKRFLDEVSEVSQIGGWQVDVVTNKSTWSPLVFKIHELESDVAPDLEDAMHFYPPGAREMLSATVEEGIRNGTPWDIEIPLITAKGRRIWVRGVGKPFYENGVLTKLVGSLQDISERVAIQERLRRAEKLQAITQLSGGVAHDLNNLLTAIISATSTLDDDRTLELQRKRAVETIKTAAQRAGGLTQSLLAYARQQVLAPQQTDLNTVVRDTVAFARPLMPDDVAINLDLDAHAPHALLDPAQLSAAVLNLVLNARDAMPDGGEIHIRTKHGEKALLEVSDTGAGISAEALPRIFDPFFTTKGPEGGFGLGLSAIQGFVEQSGGSITAQSEPGAGATFTLEFPLVAQTAAAAHAQAVAPSPAPCAILLVEDDALVRDALEMALQGAGYSVITARDGPSALALAADGAPFDVLVTDVMMPGGLSGPELATQILARRPQAKALLVSGYARESLAALTTLADGVGFIAKPFELAELQQKITALLRDPPASTA